MSSIMYCALCARPVEAGRQVGVGTIVLAVFTGGLSLIAVPFYKKRCPICKSSAVSESAPDGQHAREVGSAATQIAELKGRLEEAAGQIEYLGGQLHQAQTERDFYRQLLGDRAPEEQGRGHR